MSLPCCNHIALEAMSCISTTFPAWARSSPAATLSCHHLGDGIVSRGAGSLLRGPSALLSRNSSVTKQNTLNPSQTKYLTKWAPANTYIWARRPTTHAYCITRGQHHEVGSLCSLPIMWSWPYLIFLSFVSGSNCAILVGTRSIQDTGNATLESTGK